MYQLFSFLKDVPDREKQSKQKQTKNKNHEIFKERRKERMEKKGWGGNTHKTKQKPQTTAHNTHHSHTKKKTQKKKKNTKNTKKEGTFFYFTSFFTETAFFLVSKKTQTPHFQPIHTLRSPLPFSAFPFEGGGGFSTGSIGV